jgi:hypothetical protein
VGVGGLSRGYGQENRGGRARSPELRLLKIKQPPKDKEVTISNNQNSEPELDIFGKGVSR